MVLGVAEWLSKKLGWNVRSIRILFVVSVIFFGIGIGVYLILWLVMLLSK